MSMGGLRQGEWSPCTPLATIDVTDDKGGTSRDGGRRLDVLPGDNPPSRFHCQPARLYYDSAAASLKLIMSVVLACFQGFIRSFLGNSTGWWAIIRAVPGYTNRSGIWVVVKSC